MAVLIMWLWRIAIGAVVFLLLLTIVTKIVTKMQHKKALQNIKDPRGAAGSVSKLSQTPQNTLSQNPKNTSHQNYTTLTPHNAPSAPATPSPPTQEV